MPGNAGLPVPVAIHHMKISVILPFYNEEKQIPYTLDAVSAVLDEMGHDYELVLIDDGSKDRTWQVLQEAAASRPNLRAVHFSRNFGKEAAICAGLDLVEGDCVILMDGDLQHPPSYIPQMVKLWSEDGYEVVEGIKEKRQKEGLLSRWAARTFYKLFRWLGGFDLQNASDFKLLDRKVVEAWRGLTERATFFRGLSAWLGFKRVTMPFVVADRTVGTTKWSIGSLIRLSSIAVTSFSSKPLQMITIGGFIAVFFSFVLMIQTLVNYIIGRAANGFTTVILLLLLMGGCTMMSLGLIGSYIGRIYDEIKDRPRYIISEIRESAGMEHREEISDARELKELRKQEQSSVQPS